MNRPADRWVRAFAAIADQPEPDAEPDNFVPPATAAGFRSVHAFPLRLRSQVIGALNVFGTSTNQLGSDDIPIVQALADLASIAILHERAISRGEELSAQLQSALNSRVTIEQAKGAIAQRDGVSVDEAFARIRRHARSTNQRLIEVSRTIVTDLASIPDCRGPVFPRRCGRTPASASPSRATVHRRRDSRHGGTGTDGVHQPRRTGSGRQPPLH
ncbi:GAF domain-containing protein [Micromonospora pisi]|uniref:GAF domain-containing protein n=1 Tax=Micromonospora pisi TaxID=589240 RepID=A0A495JPX4_9ACTN|nr:GAF and ANTAR domain-containing protein [Micromonospora pisi]RKR90578.1 GAF domain-containing protein [Micromonospora pisi]